MADLTPAPNQAPEPQEVAPDVQKRIDRGRKRMREGAPMRNLCLNFWRGNQYVQVSSENYLVAQSTVTNINGTGKPRHRVRQKRNLILDAVAQEVSAATSRVPSYEVSTSTEDPEDYSAAKLAEKVALYGYDKWNIRKVSVGVVTYAVVADMGFAWPYFDTTVGAPVGTDEQGNPISEGEVSVRVFGPNEVFWEPGIRFDESRWHCVEQARPLQMVYGMPNYMGGVLKADATTGDNLGKRDDSSTKELVMVTEYLERPSPKLPQGRRVTIANKRQIVPTEDYPCKDGKGQVVDEPVLHALSYFTDPDWDRDMGLVRHLIDPQRAYNDCVAGETLVVTKDGLRRADELRGEVETLAGDGRFRPATWKSYGVRPLFKVSFSDGSSVHATERHKWITSRGQQVKTLDLIGKRIPLVSLCPHLPVEDEQTWEDGVRNGLVYGDGHVEHHRRGVKEYVYGRLRQYGDTGCDLLERFFEHRGERKPGPGGVMCSTHALDPALKQIPSFDRGIDYLRGFLAGLIAADGSIAGHGAILIYSANRSDLDAIATIARSVGVVVTSIRRIRGGTPYKADAELWAIGLAKASFVDGDGVDEVLIVRDDHREQLMASLSPSGRVRMTTRRVVSVESTNRVEEVYCCVEPETHSWVLGNGLVTSNCHNKAIEWKNLCLNPQIMAPVGSMQNRLTDEPGAVFYYKPIGGQTPQWRQTPNIPGELFQIAEQADRDIRRISSQFDIPSGISAAYAVSAILDREAGRRGEFFANLADFHSRLMRHCLYLVQQFYTEPRLLKIRGRFGPENEVDFRGSDLQSQADVTVLPGSIEPRTRQAVEQKVMNMFQLGLITAEQCRAGLDGGYGEKLIDSYELDVARANRVIQMLRAGPDMFLNIPPRTENGQEVPGWMPRKFDNAKIHLAIFEDWMKTEDWDMSPPPVQEAANLYYEALQQLEAEKEAEAAAAQAAQAAQLGISNAAAPQKHKPMPSLPAQNGGQPPTKGASGYTRGEIAVGLGNERA